MLTKGFLKKEISTANLGKRQFWTGIIMGVLFAVVVCWFFTYSRESLRMMATLGDPNFLTKTEIRIYDLFFAGFAASLGFGFTVFYWLTGRNNRIKKNYLRTFALSNTWLISFVTLMSVARFGTIRSWMVYGFHGNDGQLNLLRDFRFVLILIPIYVFFAHWNTIRMIFRAKTWVSWSLAVYILITMCLYYFSKIEYSDYSFLQSY